MRKTKIILKLSGFLILVFICLCFLVTFFSTVETKYKCVGTFSLVDGHSERESTIDGTIYMRLSEYRWWVGLWSESDGMIEMEIPDYQGQIAQLELYLHLKENGDQIQIYDNSMTGVGRFSKLSNQLDIKIGDNFFAGECNKID